MNDALMALEQEILELKKRRSELRRLTMPEPVDDYALLGPEGPVRLSDLFQEWPDLLVVHNMGRSCSYCSLWADGFQGHLPHLESRCAFVVVSPDSPVVQQVFAKERGWTFRMVQDADRAFTEKMGMWKADGGYWPGVSALRKRDDGSIVRVNWTFLGPMDDYCPVWPLFDMLEGGAGGWEPQ